MAPASNNESTTHPNSDFVSLAGHHERIPVPGESPTHAGSSRGMRSSASIPRNSRARRVRSELYPHALTSSSPMSGPHLPPHHLPSEGARASNAHRDPFGRASRHNAPSSPPDDTWGSRSELSAGRRRLRGVSTGQNVQVPGSSVAPTVGSNASARKEQEGESASAVDSGPTSSSSEGATTTGESGLTEWNVRRASDFYEHVRRERDHDGEREGESSREAALCVTLDEVNKKMREEQ